MSWAIETIEWFPVAEQLPDATITVLLFNAEAVEPVWPGFCDWDEHDNVIWHSSDGFPLELPPTHWSDMPDGPDVTTGAPA